MNCRRCGRFMIKEAETESRLEPDIIQWWRCAVCEDEWYPEVIATKTKGGVIVYPKVSEE